MNEQQECNRLLAEIRDLQGEALKLAREQFAMAKKAV